jgi:hypothetical protein
MSLGTLIVWLLPCDLEATIALTPQIKEISDTDTTFAYVVIFNYSILFKLFSCVDTSLSVSLLHRSKVKILKIISPLIR